MMVRHFDHVTIVVRDVDKAKAFFALLGFQEDHAMVISGEKLSTYMGINDMEADHVTLVLKDASPRLEVQLLKYHRPEALADPAIGRLDRVGFNHICFAVDDLDAVVETLVDHGMTLLNDIMEFDGRRLVFVAGPERITVELAERRRAHPAP